MCVIFHKPAGIEISEKDLRNAHRVNNDGFGFMYYDAISKRIIATKFLTKDPEKILKIAKLLEGKEVCYHFRIRTHGLISNQACHPFKVTDKKKHGMDIYFMHNGTITGPSAQKDESDTQAFNNTILFPLLKSNPKFIETEACKNLIEKYVGTHNRLCFMYGEGKVLKFNEAQGDKYEGMWVSNKNFVTYERQVQNTWGAKRTAAEIAKDNLDWESEMCDYYGSSYSGHRNAYQHNMRDNVLTLPAIKRRLLSGNEVALGDTVWIWQKADGEYVGEGIIKEFTTMAARVEFKNLKGEEILTPFFFDNGESGALHPGYECMAMDRHFNATKTVDDIEGVSPESKARQERLAQAVDKLLTEADKAAMQGPPPKQLVLTDQTVKAEIAGPVEVERVFFGQVAFNALGGYGGAGLEDSLQGYKDEITILDIYNMGYQDRFSFFMKNPETSYLMFQDMVEKMVFDDIDAGVVNDEDDDGKTSEATAEELILEAKEEAEALRKEEEALILAASGGM